MTTDDELYSLLDAVSVHSSARVRAGINGGAYFIEIKPIEGGRSMLKSKYAQSIAHRTVSFSGITVQDDYPAVGRVTLMAEH